MIKAKKKITKNWTISEVITSYPECAEVFLMHGFPCVGCSMSGYETIEQGALVTHGMDERFLNRILKELNETANKAV